MAFHYNFVSISYRLFLYAFTVDAFTVHQKHDLEFWVRGY